VSAETSFSRGMILITSPVLNVITMLLPTASIVSILSTLLQHQQAITVHSYDCHQQSHYETSQRKTTNRITINCAIDQQSKNFIQTNKHHTADDNIQKYQT